VAWGLALAEVGWGKVDTRWLAEKKMPPGVKAALLVAAAGAFNGMRPIMHKLCGSDLAGAGYGPDKTSSRFF
jgi:hypothetical protein